MAIDPILKEVHALKDQLARDVDYNLHALCKRLREAEQRHPERLVSLQPFNAKNGDAST